MILPELPKIAAFEIPKDGKDCFQIGEYTFKLKRCEFSIAKMTHEFYTVIKAQLPQPQKAITDQLLDDYDENGLVSLEFACLGIHNHGVPTGEFVLEEDKSVDPYFYLRRNGFQYSLSFYGNITFRDGWMAYNGYFKPSYNDTPVFHPVKIYKKINCEKLNWREYYFSSLTETEGVADDAVQYLKLEKFESAEFPERILSFKKLKNLSIGNYQTYHNNTRVPLSHIPEAVGELINLQGLHLTNCAISELPQSIGQLKKLENLNVSCCQLQSLPSSVFQLPKLMYIFAFTNQIRQLPEEIDLPKLYAISVENNQLQTLPETLARQPLLNRLSIDNNPLAFLPTAFNTVKGLELNIDDKRRLLDFEYRGADGKGIVAWDNTLFFADKNSSLLKPAEEIIAKNKLAKYKTSLLALARKTVGFQLAGEEKYEETGNHRFGGMPDLPATVPYPEFWYEYEKRTCKYEFIAQINCQKIASLQGYLPRTGMLYFFFASIHLFGVSEAGADLVKVIYVPDGEPFVSGKELTFSNDDYLEMMGDGCYTGYQANASEMVIFPDFYAYHTNAHIFTGRAESLGKAFKADRKLEDSIYDRFSAPVAALRTADFEINGYVFTQHESPELQAALSRKGNAEDWIPLLNVSSRGVFQWGDDGDLAFVIHKSDLIKMDFTNVFCTMESS